MKYLMASLVLLVLVLGCSPAGNLAPSQPQKPAAPTGQNAQPPVDDSAAKSRISGLESQLAACQSTNTSLQGQIDRLAAASNVISTKEPVAGDIFTYNMKGDKPGLQYPNKYVVWDILAMECSPFEQCKLNSRLINNHPTLAMTNITINNQSAGSEGTSATITHGQSFTNTKSIAMPNVVDYQVTLRWVWQ